MNNTERANALRYIMSNRLSDFETETMEQYFEMNKKDIETIINRLELNEFNYKAIRAIRYILSTL